MIAKLALKYFREDILKLLYSEASKGSSFKMEHALIDGAGRAYRRFTDQDDLPLERIGKMQDYLELMSSGVSEEELSSLVAAADNELARANNQEKFSASKVGWVLQEILLRQKTILHPELLYNLVAVQLVREDEPISEFVESIQQEKVIQFKADTKGKDTYFFFQIPELKLVNKLLKLSESEWNQYWQESLKEISTLNRKLSLLNTVKDSVKKRRTGAPT